MKIWMVNQVFEGKFLPIIDGPVPNYGGFDFRISNGHGVEIEVVAGCEEAEKWQPSIAAGIRERSLELEDEGHRFMGLQVVLTRIYSHNVDTTAKGMKYRGRMFVDELLSTKWTGSRIQCLEE